MELICVTMKTEGRQVYVDTASLFDFCFDNFKKVDIGTSEAGEIKVPVKAADGTEKVETVPVQVAQDGYVIIPSQVNFSDLKPMLLLAAAEENADTGVLEYTYGTREVGQASITLPDFLRTKAEPEETEPETENPAGRRGKGWGCRLPLVVYPAGDTGGCRSYPGYRHAGTPADLEIPLEEKKKRRQDAECRKRTQAAKIAALLLRAGDPTGGIFIYTHLYFALVQQTVKAYNEIVYTVS